MFRYVLPGVLLFSHAFQLDFAMDFCLAQWRLLMMPDVMNEKEVFHYPLRLGR